VSGRRHFGEEDKVYALRAKVRSVVENETQEILSSAFRVFPELVGIFKQKSFLSGPTTAGRA
jgi:hypothetical protein